VASIRQFVLTMLMLLSTILALGSNACADAGRSGGDIEGRLTVQRVEINVVRSIPPEIFVRVHGVVLNGCTDVGAVTQHKTGHIVTLTIPTHSRDRVCTMMARLIDKTIRLKGDFAPGFYTLNVNGVVEQFWV
jgi:hypothetical protein